MKFRMTKIATAIAAATLASSANAVVVVGGDNGWEVSFDGNVNLFYNHIEWRVKTAGGKAATAGGGPVTAAAPGAVHASEDSSHLNEGLLPAFFSFSAKSPTVNGLTGTARISFAPDSSAEKSRRLDKSGGAGGFLGTGAIDMREVVANVDGSFGTISFGRTLGLFGRQAILKDQTLFGVGASAGPDGGGTTLGRIGFGYVYPAFDTRFAYKTPNINGFQLEVGLFDPLEPTSIPGSNWETNTPRFEGEATYATTFTGGTANVWVGGLWQEQDRNVTGGATVTHNGVDFGGQVTYSGFDVAGHYYTGDALGTDFKWAGASPTAVNGFIAANGGQGLAGLLTAPGFSCTATGTKCREATNDGWFVQGGYTFNGKTHVEGGYAITRQDSEGPDINGLFFNEVEHVVWTVGVYHDVTSWLKLVAEYNNGDYRARSPGTKAKIGNQIDFETFSVGAFMTW